MYQNMISGTSGHLSSTRMVVHRLGARRRRLIANSHRPTRHNSTVELSKV